MTARRTIGLAAALLAGAGACGVDGPDAGRPTDDDTVPTTVAPAVGRNAAVDAAVDVRAAGCGPRIGFGTGTLVADRVVLTAAHVVAGADEIELIDTSGAVAAGQVVLFDPDLDFAAIRTDAAIATPLPVREHDAETGELGIVVLPRRLDGMVEVEVVDVRVVRPANIRTTDIYLDQPVERPGFEIEGSIDPGDSGAMVVLPGGGVGIVWARSNVDQRRAWAIDLPDVAVDGRIEQMQQPVDVGPCIR